MAAFSNDNIAAILDSGLFDAEWYLKTYPDVKMLGMDPLEHYLWIGAKLARKPSAEFDATSYLRLNPDVAAAGVNPLLHYIKWGRAERRFVRDKEIDPDLATAPLRVQNSTTQAPKVAATDRANLLELYVDELLSCAGRNSGINISYVPKSPTAFDLEDCPVKAIAFYLPQFHPIPENDAWWGSGFTEWTNVSKSAPRFVGHYQPHLPGELGFYDLRLIDAQRKQAALAKHYGIYGFCYHHYWFGGRRLLERPFNQVLATPDIDLPFCLCWANENWTRRWDGLDHHVLMAQNHSPEDDLAFIADIAPALRDPRYIRVDGRPLVIIYRPGLLPDAAATAQRWRDYCQDQKIGDLYLVAARTFGTKDPKPFGFDASVEFPPHEANARRLNEQIEFVDSNYTGSVFSYEDMVSSYLAIEAPPGSPLIKTVAPGWDNEPRKPGQGHTFFGSSPTNYARWLRGAIETTLRAKAQSVNQPPFVFINAWNEWAEGAHLEPDRRFGYAYLHATANVLTDFCPINPDVAAAINDSQSIFTPRSNSCIVLHLYYSDLYEELLPYLRNAVDSDLFISLDRGISAALVHRIRQEFPNVYLEIFRNRGRDMLPFLGFMEILLKYKYAYGCKIHSKKSLHRNDGKTLRDEALASLLGSPETVCSMIELLNRKPAVGMIARATSRIDLSYPERNILNRKWLDILLTRLDRPDLIGSYKWEFSAGTMFWFRVRAVAPLIALRLTDEDFEEELGQVDGTLAHSLERTIALLIGQTGHRIDWI